MTTIGSPSTVTSAVLSPDSFSLIHSREATGTDSSESYSSFELSDDPSDDEIVWSLSGEDSGLDSQSPVFIRSQGALSPAAFSDEDIVVLSRPRSVAERYQSLTAPGSVEALANTLSKLNVTTPTPPRSSPRRRKPSAKARSASSSKAGQPSTSTKSDAKGAPTKPKSRKKKKKVARDAAQSQPQSPNQHRALPDAQSDDGLSVVDDVSEDGRSPVYDEAVQYVTDILSKPSPTANSNLKLLHALIIELGLAPTAEVAALGVPNESLPRSLRAARALLKSKVFVNVCDYLAVRGKGLDALRSVMHPSRQALVKDIRGSRKKMAAKEVKKNGLGVFLVTCYR